MAVIEFGLLGPLAVHRRGVLVPIQRGKQRAVLAALLLDANRGVSGERLAEALWGPGEPPPSAPVTVRNYVKRLRQALGDAGRVLISTQPGGYLLSLAAGDLDVAQFEVLLASARTAARIGSWDQVAARAGAALALWRGEPLEDVESQVLAQREVPRLTELRLQATELRIDADLRLGRHADVVSELQRLAGAHPLREQLHALLMLALYRCGRQAEALAFYQEARRILIQEVGTEPAATLRDLQQRMLAHDPALSIQPSARPAAEHRTATAAPVQVPRQMPGLPPHFTGRSAELAALTSLLNRAGHAPPGTVVISAVGGTAGVGKTALAVHWAHQAAHRFPDGQLYVNLRGYDPGPPVAAADALAGFLRTLGLGAQEIPADEDERAARYRTLLARRRLLVVLDNASSAEQVRPLLPGTPGCMAIVTSRDSLAGLVARDGAVPLRLGLLPVGDAVSLLRSLIGARVDSDPGAAAALAGQCAMLPLALRVAAELAAARPGLPLADLVSELADQQRRLDRLDATGDARTAVRAVFSWSCRQLDAETHRAFRLAALHPGPELTPESVAALTGRTPAQAGLMLDHLARAHLVHQAQPGRYGLHDLLRAYARELATAHSGTGEARPALGRLFRYYLHGATAAMDLSMPAETHRRPHLTWPASPAGPSFRDAAAARDWLDRERASLVAVAEYMSTHGWPGQASRLAAILFRHFQASGHYPEAIALHTSARQAAQVTRDRSAEATALTNLAATRLRRGDVRQATGDLQQALALTRESGDSICAARALHTLGNIGVHQGRYQQAAGYYRQALAVYRRLDDRTGEARTLNNLGAIDELTGRYQEAGAYYRQGLLLYRQTGEQGGEARALGNLGCLHRREGRYPQAAELVERSLAVSRAAADRGAEAYAMTYLGDVRRCQGRYQQAAGHYEQALAWFRASGDRSGEVVALNGAGETSLAAAQHRDAGQQHAAALDLAGQTGDRYEQARAHHGLARACHEAGRPEQAGPHWAQALAGFTRLGTPEAALVRAQITAVAGRLTVSVLSRTNLVSGGGA